MTIGLSGDFICMVENFYIVKIIYKFGDTLLEIKPKFLEIDAP